MSRQLNLRVSDEFAERLEKISLRIGRPMAAVLEMVGTPAIEASEAGAQFESEARRNTASEPTGCRNLFELILAGVVIDVDRSNITAHSLFRKDHRTDSPLWGKKRNDRNRLQNRYFSILPALH